MENKLLVKKGESKRGIVFVISGPSGGGKTTLCQALARDKKVFLSISCTTRPPRSGEKPGRDYYFLSRQKFRQWRKAKFFLEWACVHQEYYGTPRAMLEKKLNQGWDVILDIDVQGGMSIRRAYPDSVLIFVLPSFWEELRRRIIRRGQDSSTSIRRRLQDARSELAYLPRYDYLLINDSLNKAIFDLKEIRQVEKKRISRLLRKNK